MLGVTDLDAVDVSIRISANPLQSWRELGHAARLFDVAAASYPAIPEDSESVFEQLLFESGRPMLLAPAQWPHSVGDCIAIAWNRSTETARLVSHAREILRRAREVHVIDLEGWHVDGPDGAALTHCLTDSGVPARLHAVQRGRGEPGGRILQEAHRIGADLLLKGAYTQSRLTQVIFGGATRDILRTAGLPVLFAH